MESIDRIISIADKVYLWEDFSQDDYTFFCKYMSTAIPIWYTGNKEDLIMDLFLQIREDNYKIDKNNWRKKKFLEKYLQLFARDREKDSIRNWEKIYIEDLENLLFDEEDTPEKNYMEVQVKNAINALRLSFSPLELYILDNYLLWDTPMPVIAEKFWLSNQRCHVKKDIMIEKIKNRIDMWI
jgi:hypothetical protein